MTKVKLDDEVLRMATRAAGAAGIPVRRWVEQAIRGAARPEIAQVWPAAVDDVAGSMSRQHRGYLRLVSPRAVVADTVLLAAPDAFTRDVVESRLRPAVAEALGRRLGRPVEVAVTVERPEAAVTVQRPEVTVTVQRPDTPPYSAVSSLFSSTTGTERVL